MFQLGPPGTTFWDGESKEFGKIRPEKEKEWGSSMGQRVSPSTTAPLKRRKVAPAGSSEAQVPCARGPSEA